MIMAGKWVDLGKEPENLPEIGERVIICVGYVFVGEGYLKNDKKWYRYCDFAPIDEYMSHPVTGWMPMPPPMKKPPKTQQRK